MRRGVLAVALLVTLLTLMPFKVTLAEESFMGANVTVLLGLRVSAPLHITQPIGDAAQATGSQGQTIPVGGGAFSLRISQEQANLTIPLALAEGQTLTSFDDPASGIQVSGDKLSITLRDAGDHRVMSVLGDIVEVRGEGESTTLVTQNVVLKSEEFSLDFSPADEKVGRVTASFQVRLKNLSEDAFVQTSISKEPDPEYRNAFDLVAQTTDTVVGDIAYTLNVSKVNLDNGTNLGEGVITMKVGRDWAERYGIDNVTIMRRSEDGVCQILPTLFLGFENGQAVFQATSPDGLSVFALTALVPLSSAATVWVPVAGGIAGGGGVVSSLVYYFIRRKRSREAALMDKWPTGLSADDWKLR